MALNGKRLRAGANRFANVGGRVLLGARLRAPAGVGVVGRLLRHEVDVEVERPRRGRRGLGHAPIVLRAAGATNRARRGVRAPAARGCAGTALHWTHDPERTLMTDASALAAKDPEERRRRILAAAVEFLLRKPPKKR